MQSYGGDGGPAVAASINWPADVAFNSNGELLIDGDAERRIRKVDAQGIISTIAGTRSGTGHSNKTLSQRPRSTWILRRRSL